MKAKLIPPQLHAGLITRNGTLTIHFFFRAKENKLAAVIQSAHCVFLASVMESISGRTSTCFLMAGFTHSLMTSHNSKAISSVFMTFTIIKTIDALLGEGVRRIGFPLHTGV